MAKIQTYIYQLKSADIPQLALSAQAFLPQQENERAEKILHPARRNMYRAGRLLLRSQLALRLAVHPKDITLRTNQKGKPELAADCPSYHFNLAHSEDWLVLAISPDCAVGIDIEHRRALDNMDELAKRVMHPSEYRQFAVLAAEDQLDYFFEIWTAKEAFVKWCGEGIGFGLRNILIDVGSAQVQEPKQKAQMQFLQAPPSFRAALAWDWRVGHTDVEAMQTHSLFSAV